MSGAPEEPTESAGEPPSPRERIASSLLVQTLVTLGALAWLHARDRTEACRELAIGPHGPWFGLLAGGAVAAAFSALLAVVAARTSALAPLDDELRRFFAGIDARAVDVLLLASALGEEFLLRCAVQDAFGWPGGVAVAVTLVIASGHRRLWWLAVLYASLLGLLVELGFGLLGSSVANVLVNHLNLRRLS